MRNKGDSTMVRFNPFKLFQERTSGVKPQDFTHTRVNPSQTAKTEEARQAHHTDFTVDMSELEVKAEMNKALGFTKTTQTQTTNYAEIDREFAKDPIAFAQKYATPEVRSNAMESAADFDATMTVAQTMTPERQAQVVEGFSQRNESPRAFTGEFLDLFTPAET